MVKSRIEKLKSLLCGMTLEEKVGQMFQVGFSGTGMTSGIKEMIENYYVGGVIYFRRNLGSAGEIASLSNELQKLSINRKPNLPLFISTDQEGGRVNRLPDGVHFPGGMVIGATRRPDFAEMAGRGIALQLKALGINMDFAPVMDVNNNPLNAVIGARSYGGDARLVAEMGIAFIKGMQKEEIIACAKHFPGHGDTTADSHLELPVIESSRKQLEKVEIYPFREAVKAGVDSIMTAHIFVPALESGKGIPATISGSILTGLLRKELGFKGLIITDGMEMKAISDNFGTIEGSVMAIEAGADIVLITNSQDMQKAAIEETIRAVRKGRIDMERIEESVLRILELKEKRIGFESIPVADWRNVNREKGEKIAYDISKAGVTLIRDRDNLIPIKNKYKKVAVIDFPLERLSTAEDEMDNNYLMVNLLKDKGIDVEHIVISGKDGQFSLPEHVDLAIVCIYGSLDDPHKIKVVKELQDSGFSLIVISDSPFNLQSLSGMDTFLTIYDCSPSNLKVAAEIVIGKYKAKGTLPVSLKI